MQEMAVLYRRTIISKLKKFFTPDLLSVIMS